ncbi:hypothetical protein C1646_764919 [Rhizophagus diaphanus]|nr:hypothetical protein C1646_764919 [Rhizophagus diaphanus] [Rhizophagus sp. MUCL 43196]
MSRSDKKDTTCVCCEYKFTRPAKLSPILQDKNQENDPEAGPGLSTQANREDQAGPSEVTQVIGEELDLPLNLKECQHLYYDLLQADDEAFEEIIPQEVGSSEVERQDAQEQDTIAKKSDHNIDIFVKGVADYNFLKELGMIEETEMEELADSVPQTI